MNKLKHQNTNILFSTSDQVQTDCCSTSKEKWHKHTGIQILVAIDGTGYYQERGCPVQLLNSGDVIFILPNVEHWHAAAQGSDFSDVVISGHQRNELVTWLQKSTVSEDLPFRNNHVLHIS